MEFQKNISLAEYTTFKIGGKAKYFFIVKNKEDLFSAITMAKKLKLLFFILGGGSNLLISDKGYKGLVIKMQNTKYKILNTKIFVEAGVLLRKLAEITSESDLLGLEWASGIPGTVGGAVFGNAGAFQKSMKDNIEEVEVFNVSKKKIEIFKNQDCQFDYRDSIFKHHKNLIILSVVLQLKKGNKKEIQKIIEEYSDYKKERQPINYPSAGCVFKNPSYFSARELVERCDLKGKKIGQAQISEKHANFIINLGKAKAIDVKKLINLVEKSVKNKFKINLKKEIQFL